MNNNKFSILLVMDSFTGNMSENALFCIIVFAVSGILLDFSRRYSSNKKTMKHTQ